MTEEDLVFKRENLYRFSFFIENGGVEMELLKVLKRNGDIVDFNRLKIEKAIVGAMEDLGPEHINEGLAKRIARDIERELEAGVLFDGRNTSKTLSNPSGDNTRKTLTPIPIHAIEDRVEEKLMGSHCKDVARQYIVYRASKAKIRLEKQALDLLNDSNEELKTENSNKNTILNSTQRDYMAGILCKDISRNYFSKDLLRAHDKGMIHIHDLDFSPALPMFNCCLVNLDDMLENGTRLSDMDIVKPKSFMTACAVTAQIIFAVSGNQYGGQTISLSHLAPFVKISKEKYERKYRELGFSGENLEKLTEFSLKKEIKDGIQCLVYNVITMSNSNGQAPFLSIFLWINEKSDYIKETAMLIEEMIQQRLDGFKDKNGRAVTIAFPKLLYVLDDNNTYPDSPYYYLTELAARCTAKRMVPDYISAKKMREYKEGNVFPCMGCVDGDEIITYKFKNNIYVESFKRMWFRFSKCFEVKTQNNGIDEYIDLKDVTIYDTKKGFADCYRIIKNRSQRWKQIAFENGRNILCTEDHPFETENRGIVQAKDLQYTDLIKVNYSSYAEESMDKNNLEAWFLGFMLCDGCYQNNHVFASIAAQGEDDIAKRWNYVVKSYYKMNSQIKLWERGKKGTYYDLIMLSNGNYALKEIIQYFTELFGGINKISRKIPHEVFSWDRSAKLAFLAGMIDADGYINRTTHGGSIVQLGSTNKELSLQQLYLAQTLGMEAKIYLNHYSKKNPDLIRYRVEFTPTNELVEKIACEKKKNNYIEREQIKHVDLAKPKKIMSVEKEDYSYDVTTESEHFEVSGIYSHNCRSFLQPYYDENNQPKFYGRFNQGVVTLNLPYVAMQSKGNKEEFWKLLEEATQKCYEALMIRHNRLKKVKSDVSPIHWQYGALARLNPGETIEKLLYNDYSSISLGYAGLYECTKYMTGYSHTDEHGHDFALQVMEFLNEKCRKWKEETHIGFSLYGTPLESTTGKFAKALQRDFGVVKNVSDHDYVTNSYHICVRENIDAFSKLKFEAEFQGLSTGGMISYIEVPSMYTNIDALLSVMQFIYENTMYAEINTKSDYCFDCGFEGEIESVQDENGKYIWRCPNCGNTKLDRMSVVRRTCGYIGSNYWNQARTAEIHDRVLHL